MFSKNNITTNYPGDLAHALHCSSI